MSRWWLRCNIWHVRVGSRPAGTRGWRRQPCRGRAPGAGGDLFGDPVSRHRPLTPISITPAQHVRIHREAGASGGRPEAREAATPLSRSARGSGARTTWRSLERAGYEVRGGISHAYPTRTTTSGSYAVPAPATRLLDGGRRPRSRDAPVPKVAAPSRPFARQHRPLGSRQSGSCSSSGVPSMRLRS